MLKEDFKKIKIKRNTLRNFGLTMGIALSCLMGIIFLIKGNAHFWMSWLAGGFLVVGLILPIALKPLYFPWMMFSVVLGYFMSRVILTILFFIIITPMSFFLRLIGKKLIELKWEPDLPSYWIKRNDDQNDALRYEKQY